MICPRCNHEINVGDWPFCGPNGHEPTSPDHAQRFAPIVYFRSKDGKVRFPGRTNAPTPAGYQRCEITNRRQAEKFEREINQREKAEYESYKYREREAANQFWAEQNAELKRRAAHFSPQGRQAVDYLLERQKSEDCLPRNFDAGFHIEIMHNDSGNRDGWEDRETGWRTRKE